MSNLSFDSLVKLRKTTLNPLTGRVGYAMTLTLVNPSLIPEQVHQLLLKFKDWCSYEHFDSKGVNGSHTSFHCANYDDLECFKQVTDLFNDMRDTCENNSKLNGPTLDDLFKDLPYDCDARAQLASLTVSEEVKSDHYRRELTNILNKHKTSMDNAAFNSRT